MAKNEVFDGLKLSVACSSPTVPTSGAPVRFGQMTGVALTDEGEGGNDATKTTVDFGPRTWTLAVSAYAGVTATAVSPGDKLYYLDANAGQLTKTATNGYLFGLAMDAVAEGQLKNISVLHLPQAT